MEAEELPLIGGELAWAVVVRLLLLLLWLLWLLLWFEELVDDVVERGGEMVLTR